jgi:predicted DNA-binding protein
MNAQRKAPTKPVPVRLNAESRDRLDSAAKKLSSNRASVIRLAIQQLLPAIEAGTLNLK